MKFPKTVLKNASLLTLASLCILSAAAAPNTALAASPLNSYSYWVRMAQTAQSCADEAAALGSRFFRATHLHVTSVKCDDVTSVQVGGDAQNLYSLEVTYLASAPIESYTAQFGLADIAQIGLPSDNQGFFTSAADCQAAIPGQIPIFVKETGLAYLSARCELSTWAPSDTFVLNIEGYGEPKRFLQVSNFDSQGKAGESVISDASALIVNAGGVIAGTWGSNVYFYARSTLPLKLFSFGDYTTAQCSEQLTQAQDIFKKLAHELFIPNNSLVRCLDNGMGGASLYSAYVSSPMVLGDFGAQSAHYYSFDECLSNVARTVASSSNGGGDSLGAICTPDALNTSQYLVVLFSAD